MTPDPFPNELVEAAAVLLDGMTCERCDGEGYIEIHDPNAAHADNPDGSHDEYCPDCCASGRAGFRKAAALIEQRVIDRLAREAGGEPRTGRGGHARTGPRSSGKDATVSDELPDAQQEAVWPDQSAMHGVLLEQVKDAYAEGIADTVAKLRVRAAEMLPEVARFTLDEIEAILGHAAPGICCAPHCWSEYGTPCGDCPADAERERQSDE